MVKLGTDTEFDLKKEQGGDKSKHTRNAELK